MKKNLLLNEEPRPYRRGTLAKLAFKGVYFFSILIPFVSTIHKLIYMSHLFEKYFIDIIIS
jgi:hypothetical protein